MKYGPTWEGLEHPPFFHHKNQSIKFYKNLDRKPFNIFLFQIYKASFIPLPWFRHDLHAHYGHHVIHRFQDLLRGWNELAGLSVRLFHGLLYAYRLLPHGESVMPKSKVYYSSANTHPSLQVAELFLNS